MRNSSAFNSLESTQTIPREKSTNIQPTQSRKKHSYISTSMKRKIVETRCQKKSFAGMLSPPAQSSQPKNSLLIATHSMKSTPNLFSATMNADLLRKESTSTGASTN